jgi:hypothetical protein
MASLERLPSGRWRVRWRQGGRGSAWLKSAAVDTKTDALGVLARVESDIAATRTARVGIAETLSVLAAAWIRHKTTAGRDPDHTRREGERLRALLRRYGWAELVALTPTQVDQARAMTQDAEGEPLRWSPRAGALLAACMRWAAERRGAAIDTRTIVALRPGPPRRTPPRALVDASEVERWHTVAASMSPDCAALVHCLTRYGWRPITAARLVVADLDTGRRVIRVPVKGGDVIEHPIMEDTATHLAALAADRAAGDPLFLDPRTGRAFAISGAYTIPQWWRDHIGAHSYDAKRWAISHLLRIAPPHEVAKITGHRTPAVLFRYAHTTEARSRSILDEAWAHRGHTAKPRRARRPKIIAVSPTNDNETTPTTSVVNGPDRI